MKNDRSHRWLIWVYLSLTLGALLPALGLAFNGGTPVWGVPVVIAWLLAVFTGFAAMTVVAYFAVFRGWARHVDTTHQQGGAQ